MADDRCSSCDRLVSNVRVHGWSSGQEGRSIPLDYVKSPEGEYAMVGPETAVYIEQEKRAEKVIEGVPLYTDHRRTCPARTKNDDPFRPLFLNLRVMCDGCEAVKQFVDEASAMSEFEKFKSEHAACRRKAS